MRNEAMLSLVGDQPYNFYHKPSDTYITYWMGIGCTTAQAMMMVANWKEMAYLNSSTIIAASIKFNRAYIRGAFGDVDWHYRLSQGPVAHFSWLSKKIYEKLYAFDANDNFIVRHNLEQCIRALRDYEVIY